MMNVDVSMAAHAVLRVKHAGRCAELIDSLNPSVRLFPPGMTVSEVATHDDGASYTKHATLMHIITWMGVEYRVGWLAATNELHVSGDLPPAVATLAGAVAGAGGVLEFARVMESFK